MDDKTYEISTRMEYDPAKDQVTLEIGDNEPIIIKPAWLAQAVFHSILFIFRQRVGPAIAFNENEKKELAGSEIKEEDTPGLIAEAEKIIEKRKGR